LRITNIVTSVTQIHIARVCKPQAQSRNQAHAVQDNSSNSFYSDN